MNFLAHLFLSGPATAPGYADLLVGQFIADSVPGRQLENYEAGVQAGIRLHRAIDTFTDQHPVVRRSTARLRLAGYGKYAGVVSDVFLDHFLARHFSDYSTENLLPFSQRVFQILASRKAEFPARVQQFLPYLIQHNWLVHYAELEGIDRSLSGLGRRAPGSDIETGVVELKNSYAEYEADFREYFPQVSDFVTLKLELMNS